MNRVPLIFGVHMYLENINHKLPSLWVHRILNLVGLILLV